MGVLRFLMNISTSLLFTCRLELKSAFFVAAATITAAPGAVLVASGNANGAATCGPQTGQPQCNDQLHEREEDSVKKVDKESDTFCSSTEDCVNQRQQQKTQIQHQKRGGAATEDEGADAVTPRRFKIGDIVELYNTESQHVQIVFPSLVKGRDGPTGGYRVTKTTDGKEVANIPDKHVHLYVPYREGDEALCNIGEFKPARPIIVRCTVLDYQLAATRGAMVLQGRYSVRVSKTKANEEYETQLPVWKLQRRYRASAER